MTGITIKRTLGTVAAAGIVIGAPLAIGTGTASAAGHDWSGVAQCESGGNWSTNTGNGYYGGLQFSQQTWNAYGGSGNPANASQAEQERVAENVLAGQGAGAWPVCGQYLASGSTPSQSSSYDDSSDQTASYETTSDQDYTEDTTAQQPTVDSVLTQNEDGTYTVQVGDTLSRIAASFDVPLDNLAPQVQNIDLIFPGQVIDLLK